MAEEKKEGFKILVLLPQIGFDPTEVAVPFSVLSSSQTSSFSFTFAVPDPTLPAACDPIMITGAGLGLLAPSMKADENGTRAYQLLEESNLLLPPNTIDYETAKATLGDFHGLLLPGGHCQDMRPYLESSTCHEIVQSFNSKPKNNTIAAICHGVVLAGRAGILPQRKVTALEWWMEGCAHNLTRLWMGNYYKTYDDRTVESEVTGFCGEFISGPKSFSRDSPGEDPSGFCVEDGNLVTGRWPGDAHAFALKFAQMIVRESGGDGADGEKKA